MRVLTRFLLLISLAVSISMVVGCGKKADEGGTTGSEPSKETKKESGGSETGGSEGGAVTKEKFIGAWTMDQTQGPSHIVGEITINEDGTFVNAGTIEMNQPNEAADMMMKLSYTVEGKWVLEGDKATNEPTKVEASIDDIQITAKDPANQKAMDDQKETMKTTAEEQMKTSLNQKSTIKILSIDDEKMEMESEGANPVKITYMRKK